MKLIVLVGVLMFNAPHTSTAQENNQSPKTDNHMKRVLIDKIIVPANARAEFIQRMTVNRDLIKQLPGFIKDEVYERTEADGNLVFITVAVWENETAIKNAKQAVEAEYKRTNFNMQEFLQKSNIKMERNPLYQPFEN